MKRGQASKPNWLYMMMIWFCSSWKERSFFYQKSVSTSPSNLTCMEKNFTYSVAFPLELELGADIWARRAPLKSTDGDGPWLPQLFFSCLAPQSPSPHKEPFFLKDFVQGYPDPSFLKGPNCFFQQQLLEQWNCWGALWWRSLILAETFHHSPGEQWLFKKVLKNGGQKEKKITNRAMWGPPDNQIKDDRQRLCVCHCVICEHNF